MATGTLVGSAASVEQGEPITFTYTTPQFSVAPENWVGLFPDPVNGPGAQTYAGPPTLREYTPLASGAVSFATGSLPPGNYLAFSLANDGYTWLAEPVRFTVRAVPRIPPPPYQGAFGRSGRGPAQFSSPAGLTVDERGQIWVADTGNDRVQAFTRDGRLVRVLAGRFK
ncbi:hypothetical protein [Amycolatopsis sp. FDAARGOS 1241]|uniref:hypothetical protein n=1 Tax=Amycolatopsis sp. FDAARGOS 1241 TaxID=2778070 RepID=UPI001EF232CA|nr:hypothetical protein [Amycolatopsis sp. FDAARGOS 1241]